MRYLSGADKRMARYLPHGGEHTRIIDAASLELLADHRQTVTLPSRQFIVSRAVSSAVSGCVSAERVFRTSHQMPPASDRNSASATRTLTA